MPGMGALQAFTHPQHSKRNLRRIFSLKGKPMHSQSREERSRVAPAANEKTMGEAA
jgi:hypothetical protein